MTRISERDQLRKLSSVVIATVTIGLASAAFGAGTASADLLFVYNSESLCHAKGKEYINVPSAAYSRYQCSTKGGKWHLRLYNGPLKR